MYAKRDAVSLKRVATKSKVNALADVHMIAEVHFPHHMPRSYHATLHKALKRENSQQKKKKKTISYPWLCLNVITCAHVTNDV